jgi:hypothetical protein
MDGQVILASSSSISNNENYMAVVDPVTWAILSDWKGPDYIGWLIDLQPTPVAIPADLSFSSSLAQRLSSSGLIVLSVQGSKWNGMFQTTSKAVWIETNKGIVEAVFFANSIEAQQIQVASLSNKIAGRYAYKIQASPPTLVHEVTIDSAFPLYFTAQDNMFLITSNADLYETLKRIFSNK